MAEHERPELRGRREEVDEPAAGLATALAPDTAAAEYLGSEVAAEPVGVAEDAESVLQYAGGADDDCAHRVVPLVHHDGVALRDAALRGGLVAWIEWNHHGDRETRVRAAAAAAAACGLCVNP